jgi:TIR domain
MGQKFFISFNSADQTMADWIAWTLKDAGHEVAVHTWEIPAGGNAPLWMNNKLVWADRLIAVISPDYVAARYSPIEWASQIWDDPDGTKGAVIPVVVRPTSNIRPLLRGLRRIDLNCSEAEARHRLIKGVDMPAPPERKPAFAKIVGEPPDSQHTGPAKKPIFVRVKAAFDKDKADFDKDVERVSGIGGLGRLIAKHPLGATPMILGIIFAAFYLPLLFYLHQSETVSLTTTAVASAILGGLWFGIYANSERVDEDEKWIEAAKDNAEYFFGLMLIIFSLHAAMEYSDFGVDSTFVAFATLAVLAGIGHPATQYQ